MNLLSTVLKNSFTTSTGEDYDIGRLLWALAVLSFFCLAGWSIVVNKQPFDALSYGTGLAAVLAGGGAALGLKKDSEAK